MLNLIMCPSDLPEKNVTSINLKPFVDYTNVNKILSLKIIIDLTQFFICCMCPSSWGRQQGGAIL